MQKKKLLDKIKTLTKRFNDAGSSAIDEIDSDLSASVEECSIECKSIIWTDL